MDNRIDQQLAGGHLREAFDGAQQLLQRARAAGEQAYPGADYGLAMACFLQASVLKTARGSEQALPLLDEARQRFEAVAKERASKAAEGMASICLAEQGDCLRGIAMCYQANEGRGILPHVEQIQEVERSLLDLDARLAAHRVRAIQIDHDVKRCIDARSAKSHRYDRSLASPGSLQG